MGVKRGHGELDAEGPLVVEDRLEGLADLGRDQAQFEQPPERGLGLDAQATRGLRAIPEAGQAGVSVRANRPRATFDREGKPATIRSATRISLSRSAMASGSRVGLPPRSAPPSAAWISTSRPPSYFLSAVR